MRAVAVVPNFNSARLVVRCAQALLRQPVPAGWDFDLVIVDDGSNDDSVRLLGEALGSQIHLLQLGENRGRSSARNAGASSLPADLLIFVDADCVVPDDAFISTHVAAFEAGTVLGFGNILTPGPGFWDEIQRDAARWRRQALANGELWTYTTQNVAVDARAFAAVGGFDPLFDRHGFEDRDLFIRLANAGAKVTFNEAARVVHEDAVGLASVSRKFRDAGLHSAWEFAERHPREYRRMSFGRLDARAHSILRALDALLWPLASRLGSGPARWLEWKWIPFRLRALAARAIYGTWFLHGTRLRLLACAGNK
jgi:GT2 family glycosyltransferase